MADSTNLSLGPSATIKLDRTVFNDEHSYREIAIRMTSGAFRFVTGHSEKAAYKITTPLATIGVRGTILDMLSQRGRTIVVLQEGASSVCTTGRQCIQLTQARRHRDHHLDRRPDHDPKDQQPALDVCRDLCGRGGIVLGHPLCGCLADRQPADAHDPPACCAGADDGKAHSAVSSSRPRSRRRPFVCAVAVIRVRRQPPTPSPMLDLDALAVTST